MVLIVNEKLQDNRYPITPIKYYVTGVLIMYELLFKWIIRLIYDSVLVSNQLFYNQFLDLFNK